VDIRGKVRVLFFLLGREGREGREGRQGWQGSRGASNYFVRS
jgi:hypothetical protein